VVKQKEEQIEAWWEWSQCSENCSR